MTCLPVVKLSVSMSISTAFIQIQRGSSFGLNMLIREVFWFKFSNYIVHIAQHTFKFYHKQIGNRNTALICYTFMIHNIVLKIF